MIWDADFMLGPPGVDWTDSYVLGEINVSSVFPMPNEAPAEIARRCRRSESPNPQLLSLPVSDTTPMSVKGHR